VPWVALFLKCLDPEVGGNKLIRNTTNYSEGTFGCIHCIYTSGQLLKPRGTMKVELCRYQLYICAGTMVEW